MHLNELAKLMRTVGDESRLKIICAIFKRKKICVSEIAEELDISVASVSHHLRVMSRENLLEPVRNGKKVCYELPKGKFVVDIKKFICKHLSN